MITRTTVRPLATASATPGLRRTRAAVILAGAGALLLLVQGVGVRFYWVPAVLGMTYLAAAAAGRSRGPLWAPGWVLTAVDLAKAAWFHAGRPADSFEFAELTVLAAGTGAVLAVAMSVLRIHVSAMRVAMAVLLMGAFNLAEAEGVHGVSGNVWFYAALLAAWGLADLLLAGPASVDTSPIPSSS
ncbi:MAG: hypothetical protein NVS3B26_25690 [Mycobacteriales bacterium]